MRQYATVYAGNDLKRLYKVLESIGATAFQVDVLFTDMLESLRYQAPYAVESMCLAVEIEHGDYFTNVLELNSNSKSATIALLVKSITDTLYKTFTETGIYDDDKLPYHYISFNGSVFLLRARTLQ